jgi:uncharacterized protein YdhG (YjbR/CyaY superfamily)
MAARTPESDRIDALLAGLPDDQRTALQALREVIAATAPEAEETFSYAAPAFRYRGHPLVSYGAATNHCSFYVMSPAVIVDHAADLAGFGTSKGAIRFTAAKPIPAAVVASLVRARMAETDARWG